MTERRKVYVVIVEDRHSDVSAKVFWSDLKAVDFARSTAREWCRHDEDYSEGTDEQNRDWFEGSGWLFYARYSCEGDCVRVVEEEIKDS